MHNLGMAANSIPDYIYFAPIINQYYNPEIIVIQLSSQDFGEDGFNPKDRNYFVINDIGDLELRHNNNESYNKLYNKLRLVVYALGRPKYSQIMEKIQIKLDVRDQFLPAQASGTTARMDDQLKLLKEAYSGTKVILLLLPFSPNIDKNGINFDDSEYLALLDSAEKTGDFYIINPQPEFDRLVEQGHLPRGFMNSPLPGEGHLNQFGHIIIGELLAEEILEIIQ